MSSSNLSIVKVVSVAIPSPKPVESDPRFFIYEDDERIALMWAACVLGQYTYCERVTRLYGVEFNKEEVWADVCSFLDITRRAFDVDSIVSFAKKHNDLPTMLQAMKLFISFRDHSCTDPACDMQAATTTRLMALGDLASAQAAFLRRVRK